MSSSNSSRKSHSHCFSESIGDFIRPTDISYKCLSNNLHTTRPPCRKRRRNVIGLKNSSAKTVERASSYQNLSGININDYCGLHKNSKSCENLSIIGIISQNFPGDRKTKNMGEIGDAPVVLSTFEGEHFNEMQEKNPDGELVLRQVFTNFILNAWRNQGKLTEQLKNQNDLLRKKESESQVVIMTLEQQLENERGSKEKLKVENMQCKLAKQSALRKEETWKKTNSSQKKEIDELESRIESKMIECENVKNESILLEKEVSSLKQELDKERKRSSSLEKNKQVIVEKVNSLELELKGKDSKLTKSLDDYISLQKEKKQLETKLEDLVRNNTSLLGQNDELKRELKGKTNEVDRQKTIINNMETSVRAKDEDIAAINKVCEGYMVEVAKIRLNSDELKKSKNGNSWVSISSLQTAAFFLLPLLKQLIYP